jgi:hypothetical protein
MSNTITKRDNSVKHNLSKNYNGWDKAIADAEWHIHQLELAILTYKERKAAGDPWPGDKKAGTEAESIPA